jgi:hypothetical protein
MVVHEIEVIIGVSLWLSKNDWEIKTISVPHNQKHSKIDQIESLLGKFSEAKISFQRDNIFASGPDIIAINKSTAELWKIECKGIGIGVSQTVKNSFDRALSSTVSYYDSDKNLRIGLALPNNKYFLDFIERKIPIPLRKALSLWIFIYDKEKEDIKILSPY